MDDTRIDALIDSLLYLGVVLIAFGAGMNLDEYLADGSYVLLLVYAALLVLGYTQLVLEQGAASAED